MFTGLIERAGTVAGIRNCGAERDLDVDLGLPEGAVRTGDSVALSGVCCTVTTIDGVLARFRLSEETLRRTWLGGAAPGDRLNVERSLRMGDPLGGHLVQGHVDGVGRVLVAIDPQAGGELVVEVPDALRRYCVEKGSLAVDGVSLTIARLDGGAVTIAVIPHTAVVTTLGGLAVGRPVNLEVDVIGKYVERMLAARFGDDGGRGEGEESR